MRKKKISSSVIAMLCSLAILMSGTAIVYASTGVYWYSTGNTDWTNASNWWTDSGHSIQATTPPISSTNAILLGSVAPTVKVNTWTQPASIDSTGLTGGAGTSGPFFITTGSVTLTITGNASFASSTSFGGTITQNASFAETSKNNTGGTISGTAFFTNSSFNQGHVVGTSTYSYASGGVITMGTSSMYYRPLGAGINVGIDNIAITQGIFKSSAVLGVTLASSTFYNFSANNSTVTSHAVFFDSSENRGTASTSVTFNNLSQNSGGTVKADATFNDGTSNQGTVNGNATFNSSTNNLGTVNGNASFNSSAYNNGTVTGTATYSYAMGGLVTLSGSMVWGPHGSGSNVGVDTVPITQGIFNDSTANATNIGSSTFYSTSFNVGTVGGDAVFHGSASNAGTVTGTATYDYASGGLATLSGSMIWNATGDGADLGSDTVPIIQWIFNDSSENEGAIGSSTFNGSSFNAGTISEPAVFNDSSTNQGTINASSTFNTGAANLGTVSGDASFNDASYNSQNPTGIVSGTATFNGSSQNAGTVLGNASFNDSAFNTFGTVAGTSTLAWAANGTATMSGSMAWWQNTDVVVGTDNVPVSSLIFNDGSIFASGAFTGNATFNDTSSFSSGSISGTATFIGDTSQNDDNTGGLVNPVRKYAADTTTALDFTTNDAPWIVEADGAVVDVTGATYDTGTTFGVAHGGSFVPSQPNGITPFTFGAVVPSVAVTSITGVSATGVTLNGDLTDDGGASTTDQGFFYGGNETYGSVASESGTFGVGAFSRTLSGLTCATTYHYQAFAVNSVGTTTSSDQTFTTSSCPSNNTGGGGGGGSSSGSVVSVNMQNMLVAVPQVPGCPKGYTCTPVTIAASPSAVSPGHVDVAIFTRSVGAGAMGSDIKALQAYLNGKGFIVSGTGAGSAGKESDYFGAKTQAALIRFQKQYGIPATGYFGPITRAYIRAHP